MREEFKKIADLCFPHITKTPEDYYKMYPARNLPEGTEVTRFAPSPTGYMHIGGVYQALIDSFIDNKNDIFSLSIMHDDGNCYGYPIILNENGKPIDIKPYEREIANRMIEEFMLVCNETIAEAIRPITAGLRPIIQPLTILLSLKAS